MFGGPWLGAYLVAASIAWFKLLHFITSFTPVPAEVWKGGDEFRVFRYRNLVVSLLHAVQSGGLALLCLLLYWPQMKRDLLSFSNPLSFGLVCFSSGYFLYDTLDIVLAGKARAKWDILIHHSAILGTAAYTIPAAHAIGYHAVAMLIEVNTVFLHARKLLQVSGWPRSSWLVRLNRYANLVSFVAFRLGPFSLLMWAAVMERSRLPPPFLAFYSLALLTLVVVNLILFWRLAQADLGWLRLPSATAAAFIRGHAKNDSMAGLCGSLTLFEDNPDPSPSALPPRQSSFVNPPDSFPVSREQSLNGLKLRSQPKSTGPKIIAAK